MLGMTYEVTLNISCLFHAALLNSLPSIVYIVTFLAYPFFPGFTAIFLWCSLPNLVIAAAKISAGGLGSPQPSSHSTNYFSEDI